MQLTDHKKFVPPMRRQARKLCTRGGQGIGGIKIPLQVVELAAYFGFYLAASLLLFGYIEESSACPPTLISVPVFTKIWPLVAEIINDPFCGLHRLVQLGDQTFEVVIALKTLFMVSRRSLFGT